MRNYLEDLIGYKTVRALGSAPVPQRAALSFEGAVTVHDDPVLEQTVVTFGGGDTLQSITYAGELGGPFVLWFVEHEGLAAADIVRVQTAYDEFTVALKLTGMDASVVDKTRKLIVNVGDETLVLRDRHGSAPSWFVLSSDYTLPVDASVEVVWLPAIDAAPAGWRLIGGI